MDHRTEHRRRRGCLLNEAPDHWPAAGLRILVAFTRPWCASPAVMILQVSGAPIFGIGQSRTMTFPLARPFSR
jgi:hypothetical protein